MSTPSEDSISRKELLVFVCVTAALTLTFAFLYLFSLLSLAKLGLMGIIALGFAFVVFSHPKVGILIAILYTYSGLAFFLRLHLAYPLIMITLVAMVLGLLRGEGLRLRDRHFYWSVVFFILFAVQSLIFSYNLDLSIASFLSFLKSLLLAILIVQFIRTPRDIELFLMAMLAGMLLAVLLGIVIVKLGLTREVTMIGRLSILRFMGTFDHPNRLAVYLSSAIPAGVYLMKRAPNIFLRIVMLLSVILLVITTFITFSRAAIFPLVFISILFVMKEIKARKTVVILLIVITIAVLMSPKLFWNRLLTLSRLGDLEALLSQDYSLFLRMKAVKVAILLFFQHPFTGVGMHNFIVRAAPYFETRIVVHNAYLEVLVGVGIFGFIALLSIYLSAIRSFLTGIRRQWSDSARNLNDLSFYLMTSLVATLIAALFFSYAFYYPIWIAMALSFVLQNIAKEEDASSRS